LHGWTVWKCSLPEICAPPGAFFLQTRDLFCPHAARLLISVAWLLPSRVRVRVRVFRCRETPENSSFLKYTYYDTCYSQRHALQQFGANMSALEACVFVAFRWLPNLKAIYSFIYQTPVPRELKSAIPVVISLFSAWPLF
jgi:hypothetical protein